MPKTRALATGVGKVPFVPDPQRAIDLRLEAARRLGADVVCLDPETDFLYEVRLHGQRKILLGGVSPLNHAVANRLVSDKFHTATVLAQAGVRVPEGTRCLRPGRFDKYAEQTGVAPGRAFAKRRGYPLIVKPNAGSRGRGVTMVHDETQLVAAIESVWRDDYLALVQVPVSGMDLRVDILDGCCVFAYERRPLQLVGDGQATVAALLSGADPRFDAQWRREELPRQPQWQQVVEQRRLSLETVLADGHRLDFDPWILNLNRLCAWGVVDPLPTAWLDHAAALGHAVGLRHFGVDFKCASLDSDPREATVIELNASPSLLQMARLGHYERVIAVEQQVVMAMFAMGADASPGPPSR